MLHALISVLYLILQLYNLLFFFLKILLSKFPFFWIRFINDHRSNGLLGRTISEQDACWLNKYGIICNTCAEMLLATATAVLYSPRKSSLESSRRRVAYASPSVACLRTDIFSFRSYWHKGSALVCTYVGTSRRAAETPTFRANKTTYAYHGSIFRLYCPPSFDLETLESINGSSDFTFLKCRGVCRSFSNTRQISWGFSWDTNYIAKSS